MIGMGHRAGASALAMLAYVSSAACRWFYKCLCLLRPLLGIAPAIPGRDNQPPVEALAAPIITSGLNRTGFRSPAPALGFPGRFCYIQAAALLRSCRHYRLFRPGEQRRKKT
jgi:hypothetical protein